MSNLFKIALPLFVFLTFCDCKMKEEEVVIIEDVKESHVNQDLFYHYSIWYAFVNKVFEGNLTAEELKTKGDIGLGSYTQLDGELIMLDGVLYQATQDGKVQVPNDSIKIVYANATFFEEDHAFKINESVNYESLRVKINEKLPSKNLFYGFKIHGDFNSIKCGGLHKQEPPYTDGLDVLIPNRPIFEAENISGTMVGFFCPEFIGNINVAAYHLHFISDDKKFGGHVMEFQSSSLKVSMDEMLEYQFVLPDTKAYREVGFDTEFQYKKK
jgi:acetolactate decarboxylase